MPAGCNDNALAYAGHDAVVQTQPGIGVPGVSPFGSRCHALGEVILAFDSDAQIQLAPFARIIGVVGEVGAKETVA